MTVVGVPQARQAAARRSLIGTIVAVAVIDQITKHWAVNELQPGRSIDLVFGVRLVHARNTGVAFSQWRGTSGIIVPIVIVILLVSWVARSEFIQPGGPRRWAPLGYGLILGGAFGNVLDRLFRGPGAGKGAVVDMVDVGFWPVFNVADAALCVGVGLTLLTLFRQPARRGESDLRSSSAATTMPGTQPSQDQSERNGATPMRDEATS